MAVLGDAILRQLALELKPAIAQLPKLTGLHRHQGILGLLQPYLHFIKLRLTGGQRILRPFVAFRLPFQGRHRLLTVNPQVLLGDRPLLQPLPQPIPLLR